jgi:hypothetical protein
MNVYDFNRSFITFRVDFDEKPPITLSHRPPTPVNNTRISIECCCELTHRENGSSTRYVLGASCKTEAVGAERDIWTLPNADFCLAASEEEFLILKSWHRNNPGVMRYPASLGPQPERQSGAVEDVWTRFKIDLCPAEGRELDSVQAIIDGTFRNNPLACRIEYDEGDYHVCIDHPIKTMNVNEKDLIYQTDTGPILLPDLSAERLRQSERLIETLDLAYSAFNSPTWAEFIINVPTPVAEGVSVNHYSRTRRIENARNAIFELGS